MCIRDSDVAVLSLDGIVVSSSIKVAGDDFDEAIVKYVKKKYGLMIGEQTAEEIKIAIGTAFEKPEPKVMEVKGRDLVTGLPKTSRVTSEDTRDALKEVTGQMSALYVFSALGLYPMDPVSGQYELGAPLFEYAKIKLPSGADFIIKARNLSDSNIYVDKVFLNGEELKRTYITFEEVLQGGELV